MSKIADHQIVSHRQWNAQRRALVAKDKEFSRLHDEFSAGRLAFESNELLGSASV